MSNKRRYMSIWKGDNEWLGDKPPTDPKELGEWHIEWAKLRKDCDWQIEMTDEFYTNQEEGDTPEWVDLTLKDEGVIHFKMARGVAEAMEGVNCISFNQFFEVDLPEDWHMSFATVEIYKSGGVNLRISMRDGYEEVEVNITNQFNEAIGKN